MEEPEEFAEVVLVPPLVAMVSDLLFTLITRVPPERSRVLVDTVRRLPPVKVVVPSRVSCGRYQLLADAVLPMVTPPARVTLPVPVAPPVTVLPVTVEALPIVKVPALMKVPPE